MKKATMKIYAVGIDYEEYDDVFYAKLEDAVKDFLDILRDDMDYVEEETIINELKQGRYYVRGKYHIYKKELIL